MNPLDLVRRNISNLTPYSTARDEYKGALGIFLDANENPYPDDGTDGNFNRYPDPLASGVCSLMGTYCGVPGKRVVAGNGSDELISIIMSILPRGAKVVVCEPDFEMYRVYATLFELHVFPCDRVTGLPDVDALVKCGQDADAVILSNPCNPTGQGLPRDKTMYLLDKLPCLCVIDEAYMDFWDQSVLGNIDAYPHLLVLKTCSKNIGLAGIRLGFAITGKELAAVIRSVKSPYNVNALTQAVGEVVLRRPQWIRERTAQIMRAKEYLLSRLEGWDVTDTKTNFVLLKTNQAKEWHASLKGHGIATRLRSDALRITAGLKAETDALMDALEDIKDGVQ